MSDMTLEKLERAMDLIRSKPEPMLRSDILIPSTMLPPDFTAITLPKPSRNRSRRVLKKLFKKVKQTAYPSYNRVWVVMGQMYAHPMVIDVMRKELTNEK